MITEITRKNADLIWGILAEKGEINLAELLNCCKLAESDFLMAMGWLAWESKISLCEEDEKLTVIMLY